MAVIKILIDHGKIYRIKKGFKACDIKFIVWDTEFMKPDASKISRRM